MTLTSLMRAGLFPVAYLATTASLSVIIIGVGLLASPSAAADLALAQGALIATFIALSANVRNLVLQRAHAGDARDLMAARLVLLPALCIAAYFLSAEIAKVPLAVALAVIARRACEWLAEVRLNALELEGEKRAAGAHLAIQALATALVIAAYAFFPGAQLWAMALWAVSPLTARPDLRVGWARFTPERLGETFRALLPHLGSTVIAGLCVYLLRVIVAVAAGREVAGLILTGVAIGSAVGTVFATVIGPSVALHLSEYRRAPLYRILLAVLVLAGGTAAAFGSTLWLAAGLSLIGSAVMIAAQYSRLRMFESRSADEIFAADVLRCLTLLVLTLAIAYLSRPGVLASVYLLDAMLAWFFYQSARRRWLDVLPVWLRRESLITAAIAALVVFPLFFQLRGTIYQSYYPMLESGGSLMSVPLPLSLPVCFLGIVLLGRYRHASLAMATLFVFFVCLVLTTIVASAGGRAGYDPLKLVLMLQFMIPAFGLVLGQIVAARPGGAADTGLVMALAVTAIAVAQLGFTVYLSDDYLLTHDFLLFSVYQHRQYVPVVFVGIFLVGLFSLWRHGTSRWLLALAAVLMAVYTVHSFSTAALMLFVAGMAAMLALFRRRAGTGVLVALVLVVGVASFFNVRASKQFREKYELGFENRPAVQAKVLVGEETRLPENVARRLDDWVLYATGIVEGPREAIFGHELPFDRAIATSAHNFYLDLVYNFGAVAMVPLATLMAYTCWLLLRHRHAILADPGLAAMALVILFILIVDNNLKVTLRQPYPAIFSYFLWGLLLSRLLELRTTKEPVR